MVIALKADFDMGRFCYGPKWSGTDVSWNTVNVTLVTIFRVRHFAHKMASCVLRRTVLSGLRKVITARNPSHLRMRNDRAICTSTNLLSEFLCISFCIQLANSVYCKWFRAIGFRPSNQLMA